jgi:hypothetical protein
MELDAVVSGVVADGPAGGPCPHRPGGPQHHILHERADGACTGRRVGPALLWVMGGPPGAPRKRHAGPQGLAPRRCPGASWRARQPAAGAVAAAERALSLYPAAHQWEAAAPQPVPSQLTGGCALDALVAVDKHPAAWAANATPWPVRPAGLGWGLGVQPVLACAQLAPPGQPGRPGGPRASSP